MSEVRRRRRTWLACALVLVAIAVPCSAWFVVGRGAIEREAEDLRARARMQGESVARALADRLLGRLEAIRDAESRRPAHHFEPVYVDPAADCQCEVHTPSPLTTGPRDPFVESYFEITSDGTLTMPILASIDGAEPDPDQLQRARERFGSLQSSVDAIRQALEEAPGSIPTGTDQFQWHSVPLDDREWLVALRRVDEGPRSRIQGFLLSHDAVDQWLRSAALPARLRPGMDVPDEDEAIGDVPLDCTRWEIAVDIRDARLAAEDQSRSLEAGFYKNFAAVSIAAVLAGLSVIALILYNDRAARQRARFAAAAAHELRTPLTGLRLYGEMLPRALDDRSRLEVYAARIAEESERLSRVVTNILGFTRLERGRTNLSVTDVDLGDVARRVSDRLAIVLRETGAELVPEIPERPLVARADPEAVEQILQNLVDNAEKYSRTAADRRIHVGVDDDGRHVVLTVRDHGPGIAPNLARPLFEPFVRGEGADQPTGLGLGLALVHELAQAQNATVEWRNRAEGGVCFAVRFARAGVA